MPKHLDRDETREKISRFIEDYYTQNDKKPAIRDISAGTGISVSSVFRILHEMEDDGTVKVEIKKQRSIVTKRMETEGPHVSIPVLGKVACGPGEEEEEHLTEYIRMPESLIGKRIKASIALTSFFRQDMPNQRLRFAVNGTSFASVAVKRGTASICELVLPADIAADGFLGIEINCGDASIPGYFRKSFDMRTQGFMFIYAKVEEA